MINVRIRNADHADVLPPCTVPLDQLDAVIPALQRWGILEAEDADLFGQFVIEQNAAYFEIVIEGDDE